MELQKLTVKTRTGKGTGDAHRNREQGLVPVVLYGGKKEPISLTVNFREFDHLLHSVGGEHFVVQLEVEDTPDQSSPALLKAIQRHPIRETVLHVDFQRIRLDEKLHTTVPLVLVGQAKGTTEGGVLDQQLRDLQVECLALDVPDHIEFDVSHLGIGDTCHVSDVAAPKGVEILTEGDRAIAAVHMPRVAVTEEAAEEEGVEGEEGAAEGEEAGEEGGEEG